MTNRTYSDRHGVLRLARKARSNITWDTIKYICRHSEVVRGDISRIADMLASSLVGREQMEHRMRIMNWLNKNAHGQQFVMIGADVYPESDTIHLPLWESYGDPVGPQGWRRARFSGQLNPQRQLLANTRPTITCAICGTRDVPYGFHVHAILESGALRQICVNCRIDRCWYDDEDGNLYEGTMPTDRRVQREILSYSANPMSRLEGFRVAPTERKLPQTLFLGVELEVKPRQNHYLDDGFRSFRDTLGGFAIAKHDGSVSGGMEICTVPATLAYHQTAWDAFFAKTAPMLAGFRATECGMHVHLSRAAMTKIAIGRLMMFITDPRNSPFVTEIAGRGANQWCHRNPKKITDGSLAYTDHYDAVSISGHTRATVEIRIFKSNVAKLGFFKNLEFAAAAAGYAMVASNRDLDVPSFCQWLCHQDRIGLYPSLATWLERRGYIVLNRNLNPRAAELVIEA